MADDGQSPVIKVELKRLGLAEFLRTDPLLAQSPLLEHLDARGRETLLANGVPRRFPATSPIYTEGSDGDSLYLVLKGDVGMTSGSGEKAIEVGTVRRGEYFGETEVLSGGKRRFTAMALNEADVAEFDRALLVRLFDRYPLFQAALRETSQARMQADSELADFLNRW